MRCNPIRSDRSIARPNLDRSDKWIHRAAIKMVRSSELTTHIMSQLSCTLWRILWVHARACTNTGIHVIMQSLVKNFAFQSNFVFRFLILIQLFMLIEIEEITFNGNIGPKHCTMFKYSNSNWNTVLFESFTGWMPDFVSTFSLCVSIPATLPNQKPKLIWKEMRFRRWNWMHEKLLLLLSLCVYVRAAIQTCKKNLCDAS